MSQHFKICTVLKCGCMHWNMTWRIRSVLKWCEDVLKSIFAQSFVSSALSSCTLSVSALSPFVPPHERTVSAMQGMTPSTPNTLSLPHSLSPTRLALRALAPFFIQSHLVFIYPKSPCSLVFFAPFGFSRYRCGLFIRVKQQEIPWIFRGPELSKKQQKSRERSKSNPDDLWFSLLLDKNLENKSIFTLFWVCGFLNVHL